MIRNTISMTPTTMDRDGIAAAQNITASTPMTLNGALCTTMENARIIGVYSAADVSSSAFTIVGTNAHGDSISDTIAVGPNNSTVVSAKLFKTITSVTPSATVAQNVEVGTVATTLSSESNYYVLNHYDSVAPTINVNVTGTINFTVKECFDNCFVDSISDSLIFNSISALSAKTANTTSQTTPHATAVKVQINSYSAGATLTMNIVSGTSSY